MRRKILVGLALGAASALIALALSRTGALDRLEGATWSWRVHLFARPGAATDRIAIVLLDQPSLDWGARENRWPWPWPREVYGALLAFCRRAGAEAVAFDVLFTEPSYMGVEDDDALGAAIAQSPGFVGAVHLGLSGGEERRPGGLRPEPFGVSGLDSWRAAAGARCPAMPRGVFPVPPVATNAALLANVADDPDADGIFRRAALFRVFDGRLMPSLSLGAWCAGEADGDGGPPAIRLERGWLHAGGRRVPIDAGGRAILRFRGRERVYDLFSAAEIIRSELLLQNGETAPVDPARLKGRYVLFGFSAPGLLDLRPTPVSRVAPGVLIHATALDNILSGDALRDAPPSAVAAAAVLLCALGGALVVICRKAWQTVAVSATFLALAVGAGFVGYALGWWWPVAQPALGLALALSGGLVFNYATEGRQKAFIKNAFRHYLGGEVIEQVLADPSRLRLGGERRELTIFFSDIEKFSTFSERLDAAALTALLNEYLTEMGEIIKAEGGYLDKFIGDAIVAFWNAPLPQEDHAVRAARAALRCQRALADRRAAWRERHGAELKMRVGLNTGEVTVGNLGSADRFNYTVLGDAANLASRLEGANKSFGTYFMAAAATWDRAGGALAGRELATLRVVGRRSPVRVFEPLAFAGEPLPDWLGAFDAARRAFEAGRFAEAQAGFDALADRDPASRAYAARCRELAADAPASWDGVWELHEK